MTDSGLCSNATESEKVFSGSGSIFLCLSAFMLFLAIVYPLSFSLSPFLSLSLSLPVDPFMRTLMEGFYVFCRDMFLPPVFPSFSLSPYSLSFSLTAHFLFSLSHSLSPLLSRSCAACFLSFALCLLFSLFTFLSPTILS